ncbi:MAG: GGDEF domain-containing protein, partial [Thioalkalivibrio sp.]
VQAFLTTRSFSTVYSQANMMAQLREQQAWTQEALLQVQEANRNLSEQASTDALTGVANRRQLLERSDIEVPRAVRSGAPLSLLCLDLDHFKRINDEYGHQAGDDVLKRVATEIQTTLRPTDLLARVGGEEFHILLPDTDLVGASEAAERIRAGVEGLEIPALGGVLRVTASVGCAQLGPDGADMKTLTNVADERLYEAKALGRNRVVAG